MLLVGDMNSLAMEEVAHNSDLWPSQIDIPFIVLKKCEPLETQVKVGIWPFRIELKYLSDSQRFENIDCAWVWTM